MLDVIPALMDVLADARRKAGASTAAVADAAGVKERTLERWEAHDNYPWGDDLPKSVEAYAKAAGVSAATLWRRAIQRADQAGRQLGREPHEVVEEGLPLPGEQKPRRSA
jgi:transcriptional regulator with XRE-family HTH domain